MIVSDIAVKNRTSAVILSLIIIIIGLWCYNALPRESSPDITIPNVFVVTDYKGVSAAEMETGVTIHIEKKLQGLDRVKKIQSISSEGLSQINIEFIPGTDIDEVLQKVKDKVDEAKGDLPVDLENDPSVFEVNFSELPIVIYSMSGTCGIVCLKKLADDLADDIEAIPGVLEVSVTGGREREVRIEVDPEKLAYYRIPITRFQRVVAGENRNTSGGAITLGDGRFQLRVPGEFSSPEEIAGLVIDSPGGRPVYLKDVARIVDGLEDETSRSRLNGREAVNIAIKKRVGENIIRVTDQINALIEQERQTWPKGTLLSKLMDQAKDIRNMVADLENNIISGLILVVVVLLFALGIRNAILVSMSIPFSMFLAFMVLYTLDITLNMVVLFSLTLALGMLVDNAIVIVENVYRYIEQGFSRVEAAMKATGEVAWPVIGSTLTTLAAFFPMIFWPGIMGDFMKYLPITLVVTLTSSLFVAMVINPALAAIFMRVKGDQPEQAAGASSETGSPKESPVEVTGGLLLAYTRFLKFVLGHRVTTLLISFAALILLFQVWLLAVGLKTPVEFFPAIDPNAAYINIDPPEGASLDYIDRIAQKIEMVAAGAARDAPEQAESLPVEGYLKALASKQHHNLQDEAYTGPSDLPNLEYIYAKTVKSGGGGAGFEANKPNHVGLQFIDLARRVRPSAETLHEIRQRLLALAGAEITVAEQEEGPPTGAPITIEISGKDFHTLGEIAEKVKEIVRQVPHTEDVQDDLVEGLPSIKVQIDRQKSALYGFTTDAVGSALKTAYNGLDISTYREGDEDFDIRVTLPEEDRRIPDVLKSLLLPSATGQLVPLTTLGKIEYTGSIGDISRINHERTITVRANVDETKVPGAVARVQAETLLEAFPLPPGYQITFTGEFEFQKESEAFLTRAFGIAVFAIFLILVTLFNSVTQPLIIMTSVLLSLAGAFLGLFVLQSPFGIIMSGVGVISLAGVVVNNAIVLIDYTNKLRRTGYALDDAVVAAGATRLRPVLLTAITTILGLLPMVTGVSYDFHVMAISWVSESTQWWRSMAIVVIFGLLFATMLTLVVVPTLYSLLASAGSGMTRLKGAVRRMYWWPYEKVTGEKVVAS